MSSLESQMKEQDSVSNEERTNDDIHRTGTLWTTTAHIITGVIGAGVLSLTWSVAQLGWIAGPCLMLIFALITQLSVSLIADCYKYPDPARGPIRNPTYMDSVRTILGGSKVWLCGMVQSAYFYGICVAYVLTSSTSIRAIRKSNCYHEHGRDSECYYSQKEIMIIFGVVQIFISQIPDFHQLWGLSIIAAIMSFCYVIVGFSLSLAKVIGQGHIKGTISGISSLTSLTKLQKVWKILQAIGDIAFSFPYTPFVLEIQDTIKSPPSENVTMKKASLISVSITTTFYMLCAFLGYAAFGQDAPGNLLTGFGFYEPFWLVDFANACIVVHLLGAYQVFAQPIFAFVEGWASKRWSKRNVMQLEYHVFGRVKVHPLRMCWRSLFVVSTTILALLFPLFNDVLGILGALVFWPLVVYLPIKMYIVRRKVEKWTGKWIFLQCSCLLAFVVTVLTAAACIEGLIKDAR